MANVANLTFLPCLFGPSNTPINSADAVSYYRAPQPQPLNLLRLTPAIAVTLRGQSQLSGSGKVTGAAGLVGRGVLTPFADIQGLVIFGGDSTLSAVITIPLFGKSQLAGAGQVVGQAAFSGSSKVSPIGSLGVAALLIGESLIESVAYYPKYTAWEEEIELFHFSGVPLEEVDAAFEQASRVVVAAQRTIEKETQVWLYWFDPFANKFVFEAIANGRNPRLILDNPEDTTNSDILLFYIRLPDQVLVYRQQRDRYAIEYETPIVQPEFSYIDLYLQDVVKDRASRLALILARRTINQGTWAYDRLESVLYPVKLADVDEFKVNAVLFQNTGSLRAAIILVSVTGVAVDPSFGTPDANLDVDEFTVAKAEFQSGTLADVVIRETLQDIDEYIAAVEFESGTLIQVVKVETLFDIDEFTAAVNFQSGTLVKIVIVEALQDIGEFQAALSYQAAGSSLA